jgi:hypothetical protein
MLTDLLGQQVSNLLPIIDWRDHLLASNLLTIRNIPRPSLNFQFAIIATVDLHDD